MSKDLSVSNVWYLTAQFVLMKLELLAKNVKKAHSSIMDFVSRPALQEHTNPIKDLVKNVLLDAKVARVMIPVTDVPSQRSYLTEDVFQYVKMVIMKRMEDAKNVKTEDAEHALLIKRDA